MTQSLNNRQARNRRLSEAVPALRRFALSLTSNLADADDLMQTTLEKAMKQDLPADDGLTPWLFTVARNTWIDELRHRKIRQPMAGENKLEPSFDGEANQINRQTLHELEQKLRALPDEQRSVLELVAVEGMSYKEAASVLDIPSGTVMSRLARARTKLVELMQGDDHAE